MPESPRTKAVPPRPSAPRVDSGLGTLQVRYFGRMSPRRVYGVTVGWEDEDTRRPAGAPPVTLRLLMAGAQVVPVEQTLDPADPEAKATFYVTPLAKGWLRNERLEILVAGRKVQEMSLPAMVTSQRGTWLLLALALLIPAFLLSYCKYSPLQLNARDLQNLEAFQNLSRPEKERILANEDPVRLIRSAKGKIEGVSLRNSIDLKTDIEKSEPGKVLEIRVTQAMPEFMGGVASNIGEQLGNFYDKLIEWTRDAALAFWAFIVFLVLAILSFMLHQDARKKRLSKPIPLPRVATESAGRQDEVVAVQAD